MVMQSILILSALLSFEAEKPAACPPRRGVVIVLGGIGGVDPLPLSAKFTLPRCGVPHEVRDFRWHHGIGRFFKDLRDVEHLKKKGAELAKLILCIKKVHPNRPIYLLAHSAGTGVALFATEHLPLATLERIILLNSAASPGYDLRPALRATRGEIVHYHSKLDSLVLDWGTSRFGTVDRVYTPSAGLEGFVPPPNPTQADRELYQRLVQIGWRFSMWPGFNGAHNGTSRPLFLKYHVVPWLR